LTTDALLQLICVRLSTKAGMYLLGILLELRRPLVVRIDLSLPRAARIDLRHPLAVKKFFEPKTFLVPLRLLKVVTLLGTSPERAVTHHLTPRVGEGEEANLAGTVVGLPHLDVRLQSPCGVTVHHQFASQKYPASLNKDRREESRRVRSLTRSITACRASRTARVGKAAYTICLIIFPNRLSEILLKAGINHRQWHAPIRSSIVCPSRPLLRRKDRGKGKGSRTTEIGTSKVVRNLRPYHCATAFNQQRCTLAFPKIQMKAGNLLAAVVAAVAEEGTVIRGGS